MATFVGLTSIISTGMAVWLALQVRVMLKAWTAFQAWTWMIVALLSMLLHTIMSLPVLQSDSPIVSASAYLAATMLLTPLVAILGARRPGISTWHWFVVLPMILVLQWPAVTQLHGNHWRAPIELSGPSLLGVVIVLLLSVGTLLGTYSSTFAILYASGISAFLSSGTTTSAVMFGPMLILAAIWTFHRNLKQQTARLQTASTVAQRANIILTLFNSLYGLAWSSRIQDRINQFGPREQWTVRLTPAGFERMDGRKPTDDELLKPLEAFIWVFSRFGDEAWLRQELESTRMQ